MKVFPTLFIFNLFFIIPAKAQNFQTQFLGEELEAIADMADMSQIADKWEAYYNDFYFKNNYVKRKWNFYWKRNDPSLKEFSSDGCSSFPDGTDTHPTLWRDCCIAHDLAYWVGGTEDQKIKADTALASCVEKKFKAAYTEDEKCNVLVTTFKNMMKNGVAVGGSPVIYAPWRWGYGVENRIDFDNIPAKKKVKAKDLLKKYRDALKTKNTKVLTTFGVPDDYDFVEKALNDFIENNLN